MENRVMGRRHLPLLSTPAVRALGACLAVITMVMGVGRVSAAAGATARLGAQSSPPYWLLRGPGVTSFGAFAGYVWRGDERSVAASWTVPRVTSGPKSVLALAGTWIGAQSPGGGRAPFIQVGINEAWSPVGNLYFAFYSDTKLSFHPHSLFPVRAGDTISASLRLADKRWHVLIVDHTHLRKAAFGTSDDADAVFNQAEWLQEDPSTLGGGHVPYPQLSTVGFRRLRVNSGAPQYAKVRSQWMSENGQDLAPSPLVNDAFSFAPTQPTTIGMHYLQIQVALDIALNSFEADTVGWTSHTPATTMASQRAALAAAYTGNIQALAGSQWPAGVQPLCNKLIAASKLVLNQTRRAPTRTSAGLARWIREWVVADSAVAATSQRIRRVLNLPQLFPLPRGT
jgi:acyl dehydratase